MGTPATAAAPRDTAARLFEQYGPQLYRFCLGRLRSREEAEDAVQSTFLRVYRSLDKGTAPEYEAAWLYKIAHNVCLSRREVVGRRSEFETPRDLDEIEYAIAAPETHHEELAGLSDALADMPLNLRQAILLREWQGLSYAEIADAMGTTVSAVETLIFRARKHLAAALEPERRKPQTLAGLVAGLLGRFRDLLSVAGTAKVAAGAALLAVGAAGVGTAVELQNGDAATGPKPSASTPAAVSAAVPGSPVVASHAITATFTKAAAVAGPSSSAVTPPSPSSGTPAAVGDTPPAFAAPQQAAAATASVSVPDVKAPTVTALLPSEPLPGITPPAVTVQAPAVTLPALPSVPTVATPTVPAATLPVALPGP